MKGDLGATSRPYDKGLRSRRELAEQLGTEKSQLDFADWLIWIGDWESDLNLASLAYQESADILRRLTKELGTPQILYQFSCLLKQIGDTAMKRHDMDAAVRAYEERMSPLRSIDKLKSTGESLFDVCIGQKLLATAYQETGRPFEALKLISEGLELSAKLPGYWRGGMIEEFEQLKIAAISDI